MAIGGISSNAKAFGKHLGKVRRQVPFATANAINDTAFDGRKRTVGPVWSAAFTVRDRRFPSVAFRVQKANKRNLVAVVFDRLGRASLQLHARGGTKKPKGRHLAVPTSKVRRGARGVTKSKRPEALRGKPKFFRTMGKRGKPVIYERQRRGLKLLYVMPRAVRLRRRFRFEKEMQATVRRQLPRHFNRRLIQAVRTAR